MNLHLALADIVGTISEIADLPCFLVSCMLNPRLIKPSAYLDLNLSKSS